MSLVHIYCDGACSGNPGQGGWGVILVHESTNTERELSGSAPSTTNNQMELRAAIEGLAALKRPCHIILTTDSEYVYKGLGEWRKGHAVSGWLATWKRRGWKKADGNIPLNLGMWQQLLELATKQLSIRCVWVKGHNGHPYNERCDQLAVAAKGCI